MDNLEVWNSINNFFNSVVSGYMENNIVNVYGYIRVSTEGQVKQGYSLAEQRAEIEKYCSSKSYNLVEIFKDEGISGAKANEDEMSIERDGLLDMLASLKERNIQYWC